MCGQLDRLLSSDSIASVRNARVLTERSPATISICERGAWFSQVLRMDASSQPANKKQISIAVSIKENWTSIFIIEISIFEHIDIPFLDFDHCWYGRKYISYLPSVLIGVGHIYIFLRASDPWDTTWEG